MAYPIKPMPKLSLKERDELFWKIYQNCQWDQRGPMKTRCLVWQRSNEFIKIKGKTYHVHRVLYWLLSGVDPGSNLVCHKCNRGITTMYQDGYCVAFDHLYLGTHKDNSEDARVGGRNPTWTGEFQWKKKSKLSAAQVRLVVRMFTRKRSIAVIAERFGVSRATIRRVLKSRERYYA